MELAWDGVLASEAVRNDDACFTPQRASTWWLYAVQPQEQCRNFSLQVHHSHPWNVPPLDSWKVERINLGSARVDLSDVERINEKTDSLVIRRCSRSILHHSRARPQLL